jgi:hypothetical protein
MCGGTVSRELLSNFGNACCHIVTTHRINKCNLKINRWEHDHVLENVQRRLDEYAEKMRQRRETVEHLFGTIKACMGATHFLMKTLPRVVREMALHVLTYNLTHVMNIMGLCSWQQCPCGRR